ncbi:MAG TPA: hypothetical protein VHD35_15995 [Chitinophagaceae bacterium]|nr:hypothetical protein [Chitinophagaceae bacterium]
MKKLFIVTLVLGLISVSATAQRAPQDRLLRFRAEQGFHRGFIAPQQRFRMERNRLHFRMEQQRFRRNHFVRPRVRGQIMMRNRMNRERMFMQRQHFYKGRRVI